MESFDRNVMEWIFHGHEPRELKEALDKLVMAFNHMPNTFTYMSLDKEALLQEIRGISFELDKKIAYDTGGKITVYKVDNKSALVIITTEQWNKLIEATQQKVRARIGKITGK